MTICLPPTMPRPSIARLLFLLAPALLSTAGAEPVDVRQGDSNGSGYGFRRGERCLIVTAGHVVSEAGADITVTDRSGGKATGQRIYYNPSRTEDLALIELPARSVVACNDRWPDAAEVAPAVTAANTPFEVVRHYPGGRETIVRLRAAGGTSQWHTLAFEDKLRIIQSDSGSIVRSNGRYAGIVVSVREADDRVDVLRFDVIDRLVGDRFRTATRGVPVALEGVKQRGRNNANWTTYVASWLGESGGHPVVPAQDASARCRIGVDVIEWARSRVDNPEYDRLEAALRSCSKGLSLGGVPLGLKLPGVDRASCERQVREQMRGVPRVLPSHKLTLNVTMTPRQRAPVSKLQTTEHVEDGGKGNARAEVELTVLQQSFAQVAGELFSAGACE